MMRYGLWVATWLFILVVLVAPPAMVLSEALKDGLGAALATLSDPDGQSAIWLTLRVTVVSVAINTLFGVLAAWLLACFRFRGRQALLVLLELPLSISPVVSGLVWLLLFGAQGWFGPLLERWNIHIAFAVPGIILATLFVTLPYVVRTLLPVMELQGRHAEEAAVLAGANFWQVLWHVTLPGVRGALLSGVLLTTARSLGEFGAVSVVSGHIPGETETMPLHIENLYNGYQSVAAFTMAALLGVMAMGAVLLRSAPEWIARLREKKA
ncbi:MULTISPECIES: sulfate ABC transporter permease [Acetobacter]|jgi:sulfate transport system permease protein|uniref:Sulfate ABC transporter permease subunit CysW n=1 Tax=Acetobacter peroxydans TaxID=104098 RepID=A0A4Y3TS18_9PROT|nr:sulfate ABC transporter permease subunit [Acetobacter peroxydans]MCH4093911.1 sulfate ABC transporter permease subunit [Acetobacter peroxydans]MCH4142662.1 sulfate ABC transporter permease subunit [Acetobacter peroxydans]MCI1411094.1 sulfate ABC transporter permease subunit [Acetobacter peroxydans]MCI1440657.1 sulfate ABC transporter permease subunit [Acetobacter peroxydans]MCI1567104.1 sulfate ABC transporter permease subunit [Acetobacter peroxydans]